MADNDDDLGQKPDSSMVLPSEALPSESEPGAVEVRRETTELLVHRRIREVVRYEHTQQSIPLTKLTDPALAQALLDERDYWRDLAAERDESNAAMQGHIKGLLERHHQLDKRCALAEDGLNNANRTVWLEGVFFAIGGALFGAALSPQVSWPNMLIGLLLIVVAIFSGLHRWRNSNKPGAR